jgi:hypothetical protein
MTDIRSLEQTLLDNLPIYLGTSAHQICRAFSPGALRRADRQSFDPGQCLLRFCSDPLEAYAMQI